MADELTEAQKKALASLDRWIDIIHGITRDPPRYVPMAPFHARHLRPLAKRNSHGFTRNGRYYKGIRVKPYG